MDSFTPFSMTMNNMTYAKNCEQISMYDTIFSPLQENWIVRNIRPDFFSHAMS